MAKRILLVDDEPLIVKGLKFALESDGYETDSAGDGEQALEKIQNGNFDLILLDVMLPKMSVRNRSMPGGEGEERRANYHALRKGRGYG